MVDINGIYPNGPNQPFGGFGLVDPLRGVFWQETNNSWSRTVLTALEAVVAKNLSHNFQLICSLTRQWQHLDGTWNPVDPARFIQPNAFADNREIPLTRGNNDENSLDGRGCPIGAAWRPYSVRIAWQYLAPLKITIAGSFLNQAGDYSGWIVNRLVSDPTFGPANITLVNGNKVSNPLATAIRFAYPTRGESQIQNDTVRTLQLKIGRRFKLGRQEVELAGNIFNVLNWGSFQQYADGVNQTYSPNYLRKFSEQPPRGFALTIVDRF